jgi:hypothetical protein
MSTATLNVWITEIGDPCHIVSSDRWFVHIVDCEGKVLKWCGKVYRDIPAKCGHAQIEIPPGCYAVFASENKAGEGIPPFGNQLTHVQVVRANCCDHICVTLFSPSAHYCGTWFANALVQHEGGLTRAGVDPNLVRGAIEAVRALVGRMPADPFSANLEGFRGEERDER